MSIAQVRALLGDLPRWASYSAVGDGSTKKYVVSSLTVTADSETVTVNGSAQTKPANYSIDNDLALVTFVTAPTSGHAIVVQFSCSELSDATITALLAIESNAYLAASIAATNLAGKYAAQVDKQVGDLRLAYSQRAKAWRDLATALAAANNRSLATITAPWAGGISRSDKESYRQDTDLVAPTMTNTMQDFPGESTPKASDPWSA